MNDLELELDFSHTRQAHSIKWNSISENSAPGKAPINKWIKSNENTLDEKIFHGNLIGAGC